MVISDHGHGMRPVRVININRLLKEHGLLITQKGDVNNRGGLFEKLKNKGTHFISYHRLGNMASSVIRLMPGLKKIYISTINLDMDHTVAYITDMSGIKAYSYGGNQYRAFEYKR